VPQPLRHRVPPPPPQKKLMGYTRKKYMNKNGKSRKMVLDRSPTLLNKLSEIYDEL
jgi:hypothetical protein